MLVKETPGVAAHTFCYTLRPPLLQNARAAEAKRLFFKNELFASGKRSFSEEQFSSNPPYRKACVLCSGPKRESPVLFCFRAPNGKVPKKQKKEPETIEDFVNEIMHEKLPMAGADDLTDETVSEELSDYIDKPEAERITSVLKAKILQITYKEKQGQLVPIDKVNSVLFGYGQEIRNAFESVPDRIIDRILAVAEKRHEARKILVDEIHSTLELLADINTRELK